MNSWGCPSVGHSGCCSLVSDFLYSNDGISVPEHLLLDSGNAVVLSFHYMYKNIVQFKKQNSIIRYVLLVSVVTFSTYGFVLG